MNVVGDAASGRAIQCPHSVSFHLHDKLAPQWDLIKQEMLTSPWLWVATQNGNFFQIHTKNMKLKCALYESREFHNAAFKITDASERTSGDRTRVIRYGIPLFLQRKPQFVTGSYRNLPRNMNASGLFVEIGQCAARMTDSWVHAKEQAAVKRADKQRESDWAAQLQMLIDMQENQEFAASRIASYPFHSVEPIHHTTTQGVSYAFHTAAFDSKFVMNDLALSDDPYPSSYDGLIMGRIIGAEPGKVVLSFPRTVDFDKIIHTGYLLVVPNSTTFRVQRRAIQSILERKSVNPYLLDYLIYEQYEPIPEQRLQLHTGSFQPKQIEAIEKAVAANDFLLVQGPPGTGKTTIIVEMVKQFVKGKQRVLISSKNNLAVDNVLEQLMDDGIDCLRLGREESVKVPEVKEILMDRVATRLQQNIISRCDRNQAELTEAIYATKQHLQRNREAEPTVLQYQQHYKSACEQHAAYSAEFARVNRSFILHRAWDACLSWTKRIFPLSKRHDSFHEGWTSKRAQRLQSNLAYTSAVRQYEEENQALARSEVALQEVLGEQLGVSQTALASLRSPESWQQLKSSFEERLDGMQGQKTIASDWIQELGERQQSLYPLLVQSVQVVGATCIGINTSPEYRDAEFDVVIIDEAGQITIFDALVPMSRAKKVILIGDHMQLPPVADPQLLKLCKEEELDEELLQNSLFERLFYQAPEDNKVMLDTQFRMHPIVAEFISRQFYEGKYRSGVKPHERQLNWSLLGAPLAFVDTVNHVDKFEQMEIDEDHYVYFNLLEAALCCRYLIAILREGQKPKDIGLITPYKRQKIEIERMLPDQLRAADFEDHDISEVMDQLEIDTVDSFQGRGKEIIIYSFTRSNAEYDIGFLRELRRLNVTMTRCKSLLILIGDQETITRTRDKKARETFADMLRYIKKHGQYIDAHQQI
ncbi:ATP-dependent RecD-like DNA helicase [Paenibacillus plantiphilus]|uniref:ATP-dependent RecD-like DNA helicase n=1 Tax=Paenibacillus plantiphilus TaxID=2905650 RepID=A0ABN8GEZ7_9BACL|nr:AAA domain-containing protein [Paenibacillus plantiphilus]CAH1202660.1 ATP-dependent RecD-like DNA helicase [Paenibacillus plantiphilus]